MVVVVMADVCSLVIVFHAAYAAPADPVEVTVKNRFLVIIYVNLNYAA